MRFGTPMQQMRDAARNQPRPRGVDPLQQRQVQVPPPPAVEPVPTE